MKKFSKTNNPPYVNITRFLNSYQSAADRDQICRFLRSFYIRVLIYGNPSKVAQTNDIFEYLENIVRQNLNAQKTVLLTTGTTSIDY
jgi:predicted glycosyltransferase